MVTLMSLSWGSAFKGSRNYLLVCCNSSKIIFLRDYFVGQYLKERSSQAFLEQTVQTYIMNFLINAIAFLKLFCMKLP